MLSHVAHKWPSSVFICSSIIVDGVAAAVLSFWHICNGVLEDETCWLLEIIALYGSDYSVIETCFRKWFSHPDAAHQVTNRTEFNALLNKYSSRSFLFSSFPYLFILFYFILCLWVDSAVNQERLYLSSEGTSFEPRPSDILTVVFLFFTGSNPALNSL